ncbi:Protein of unknown function [Gryllus bimaculatus]|nr:Protein of unknown function [Gryllus bimaculatus]
MVPARTVEGRKALLPVPEDEPVGVTNHDEQVVFALPQKTPSSSVTCPSRNNSFQWQARGVDAHIARILAAHTGNLRSGCYVLDEGDQDDVPFDERVGPIDFLANGTAHLYMEAFYWIPDLVDQVFRQPVDFLYPHYFDDFCLALRSTGPQTTRIYNAFSLSVWIATGTFFLLFATMLKFVLKATCSQAILETAQIFLSSSFSNRRPRHMMVWGTLLSIVMLNSFSAVITSYLTIPTMGHQLDTLRDVMDHVDVVYNREDGEFDLEILFASVDEDALRLYDLTIPGSDWEEIRSGYAAILDIKSVLERNRRATRHFYGIELHIAHQCIWTPAYK